MNRNLIKLLAAGMLLVIGGAALTYGFTLTPRGEEEQIEVPGGDEVVEVSEACDEKCVAEQAIKIYESEGIGGALAYVREKTSSDKNLSISCHGILHAVGRVSGENGWPETRDESCQYGYLHGVLQARALKLKNSFVEEAAAWCEKLESGRLVQECLHGIGHGVAIGEPRDIEAALRACDAGLREAYVGNCSTGVMMEYIEDETGEDSFFGNVGERYTYLPERYDTGGLCQRVPIRTQNACYTLIWSLQYVRYGEDVETAVSVCATAELREDEVACRKGFSAYALELVESRDGMTWPPRSAAAAVKYAQAVLEECLRQPESEFCVENASYSIHAGAQLLELGDRTPPLCDESVILGMSESCERGRERAIDMLKEAGETGDFAENPQSDQ